MILTEDTPVHGVPANLDLAFLRGAELIQVRLGLHQLQFHFHRAGSISVQGEWELPTSSNLLSD
jgi:hypothetical protein